MARSVSRRETSSSDASLERFFEALDERKIGLNQGCIALAQVCRGERTPAEAAREVEVLLGLQPTV
jgi:hypothetical protein